MWKRTNYLNQIIGNLKCIEDTGEGIGHDRILKIKCLKCGREFYLRPYQFKKQEHVCKRNYIGLSNGVLTCIDDLGIKTLNGRRVHMLKVVCSRCGKTSEVRIDRLTSSTYTPQSCPNCVNDLMKQIADKKYLNTRNFRKRMHSIKWNAKSRGIKVLLTDEEIGELLKQDCYYCGCHNANGIDRIDSQKDYTKDNCVPCCGICNRMKNKFPLSVFLDKIKKIYNKFFIESSTTIPKGSTLQANGNGSGGCLNKGNDIV